MRPSIALFACCLAACQPAPRDDDSGVRASDAGTLDGGSRDGGSVDAGSSDRGDGGSNDPRRDPGPLGPSCPPAGPFGRAPGETAPDVVLRDCDGIEHSLHDLCERDAVWLFEYADWCPPCRSFASSSANRIYDRFAGDGLGAWMVISADASFDSPDATDCAEIRDRYGISMPVLIDPDGVLQRTFGVASNEVHIVLSRGARIEWIGHYAGDEVESRIESVLP